jgi:hypothetical protein
MLVNPVHYGWRYGWELKTQQGPSISVVLTVFFLPISNCLILGEIFKYWIRTIGSSVSVLLWHVLRRHSDSHLIINIIIIISPLQHPRRKSTLTLFVMSLCSF